MFSKLDALDFVYENDVKFIRLQFCDIFGAIKNISIMPSQLEKAFTSGISFDASSIKGFLSVEQSDLFLFPDPSTLCVLPWRPQQGKVIRFFCDIKYADGRFFEGDSRYILKQIISRSKEKGYELRVGTECEFYLFEMDEDGNPVMKTHDGAGYFDVAPYDKGENVRREICLTLDEMGIVVESSHHESGTGQHEIDFKYDDALTCTDNMVTFRTVVKTIAQKNGLYASFMPKPFNGKSGSGLHINCSLARGGQNLFQQTASGVLEGAAAGFCAGIMKHICAFTAITNPLVNSYKRLAAGFEAPRYISWSCENRSALLRVPAGGGEFSRLELRSPDPTCNPYLAMALVLAAGMDGIESSLPLPAPADFNLYQAPAETVRDLGLKALPENLGQALSLMENSEFVRQVLGSHIFEKYISAKRQEWLRYSNTVHDWELKEYWSMN